MFSSIGGSSYSAASKGMSGLISGLDTQSMVEKLLSGTQSKIDKQKANKQVLSWKQDIYRDAISSLNTFKSKFFDVLKPTSNLGSSSFYNSMTASSKSTSIKVNASSSAGSGKITIDEIKSLATSNRFESAGTVSSGKLEGEIDLGKMATGSSVDINLDGLKKTIQISGATGADIRKSLQDGIDAAFGANNILVGGAGTKISLTPTKSDGTTDTGRQIVISQTPTIFPAPVNPGLSVLGFGHFESNKISPSTALKNLNLSTELQGTNFEFKINEKTITASLDDSINEIIDKVNSSGAGVKMSYSTSTDKFNIESTETGAGKEITFKEISGNLLNAMFGTTGSGTVKGYGVVKDKIIGGSVDPTLGADGVTSGSVFKITVNGKERSLKFNSADGSKIPLESAVTEINNWLKLEFGTTIEGEKIVNNISLEEKGSGFELVARSGEKVSFSDDADGLSVKLGFAPEQNNMMSAGSDLADFGITGEINGVDTTDTAHDTDGDGKVSAAEFAAALETKLKITDPNAKVAVNNDGSFSISTDIGLTLTGTAMESLFGKDTIVLDKTSGVDIADAQTKGQNAVIVVGGIETERSSNTFDIDGVNVTLLETTTAGTKIDIEVTRDTKQVLDGIKEFVKEYNVLVEKFHKLTDADPTYKKYPPLTAAQKGDMTEKEIEVWEKQAKTGLLRNDSMLTNMLSGMRSAMYVKPEGGALALYDLGITTGDWSKNGQLNINDEALLQKLVETNPADIEKLFTDSKNGLASSMEKIINEYAKTTGASPGRLVSMAGVLGLSSDKTNTITNAMKNIDTTVEGLGRTYEREKARYWKQFNAMEKAISSMNQQSAWLTSQFS